MSCPVYFVPAGKSLRARISLDGSGAAEGTATAVAAKTSATNSETEETAVANEGHRRGKRFMDACLSLEAARPCRPAAVTNASHPHALTREGQGQSKHLQRPSRRPTSRAKPSRPVFKYLLVLPDGQPPDPAVFVTAIQNWQVGEVFMVGGGKQFRIVARGQ